MKRQKNLLWLQAGSCGGCTMAILESGSRGWFADLSSAGIALLWHPSVSLATGREVVEMLEGIEAGAIPLDIFCLEGAVLRGPQGTGRFNRMAGTQRTMLDWVLALAPRAGVTIGVGSCAAFGGIAAGDPDPTEAAGLQYIDAARGGVLGPDYRSAKGLPVVNIAGCAPHPGWIMETLAAVAADALTPRDLDTLGRPRFFADHLAHHGCSRNEFYEFKASAERPSARGCLMEHMGCKATQAVGDCNQRAWNAYGSCTDAGFACVSCTAPGFENARGYLTTPKIAGIPVGLPLDMPKAWFVALAALSKSATPRRVRENARSERIVVPPSRGPSHT